MSSIKITSLVAVALVCLTAGLATAENSNGCASCKSLVNSVQRVPNSVLPLVEVLYKPPFCSNETDCEEAREFIQTLEVLLMFQESCELVGICENNQNKSNVIMSKFIRPHRSGSKKSGSLVGRGFGRKIATGAKQSDFYPICDPCQEVVANFQKDLKLTAMLFQKQCGIVPADEQEDCQQLASKAMDKLKKETPKQFCHTIGFCP